MFWNDIEDIKGQIAGLSLRISKIDVSLEKISDLLHHLSIDDDDSKVESILESLKILLDDDRRQEEVRIATKTLDKFEDYMKNVDKLNAMINEFKGCVSMARGALEDRKACNKVENETLSLAEISQDIHEGMNEFIDAAHEIEQKTFYKLNFIYENMEKLIDFIYKKEKKSPKKTKTVARKPNLIT